MHTDRWRHRPIGDIPALLLLELFGEVVQEPTPLRRWPELWDIKDLQHRKERQCFREERHCFETRNSAFAVLPGSSACQPP